jgi:hypothetical protein
MFRPHPHRTIASRNQWPYAPCATLPCPSEKLEKVEYDYTGESVHYEGPPHRGDLAVNMALGTTLLWLPLTFAGAPRLRGSEFGGTGEASTPLRSFGAARQTRGCRLCLRSGPHMGHARAGVASGQRPRSPLM